MRVGTCTSNVLRAKAFFPNRKGRRGGEIFLLTASSPFSLQVQSLKAINNTYSRNLNKSEGAIGFFGFPVLVIFEIGFSVFALKISSFSVLIPTAVFGFPYFDIRFSDFINKKAVSRFLLFLCLIPRPHHFTSVNSFSVTSTGDVIRTSTVVTL